MMKHGFSRLFLLVFLFLVARTSDAFSRHPSQASPSSPIVGIDRRPPPTRLQRAVPRDTPDAVRDVDSSRVTRNPESRRGFVKSTFLWSSALATAFGWLTAQPTTSAASASTIATGTTSPTTTTNYYEQAATTNSGIRYYTANDIPDSLIESHQSLYGYVERVIDGDTVRIRHVPDVTTFLLQQATTVSTNDDNTNKKSTTSKMPLGNTTIVVRLYGIDAPETAKKQSEVPQPFGEDAKQLTKGLTFHKLVTVKLLRRDKYNRIVAEVETVCSTTGASILLSSCTTAKDVSVELASKGLATLYKGGGAEYDGKRDLLKQRLEVAQRSRLGIWSLGDEMVTPQEFKRQKRLSEQQP